MSVPDWPSSGAVPVFKRGAAGELEHVGYTKLILEYYPKVSRFMMSKLTGEPDGSMILKGEAEVIERESAAGTYLAWLVLTGDPRDMPGFWPA